MPYLQLQDQQFPLPPGEATIGAFEGADVRLVAGDSSARAVIASSNEVARKHASLAPAANGYVLADHGANGVWVNGARVAGTRLLGRGDAIRTGSEEFHFYADLAMDAPPSPPARDAVGGRRVRGEQKLVGFPDLRFGSIKMTFRPAAQSAAEGGSTRAIAAVDMTSLRRGQSAKSPAVAMQPAARAREAKTAGCGAVSACFVSVGGAGIGLLALLLTTLG